MERMKLLPLVKAYPALSKSYGEVSCIAGVEILNDRPGDLIRLYPVPFRELDEDQKFAKYEVLEVDAEQHSGDPRPETRRPNRDSIEAVGPTLTTENGWSRRRPFVEPLIAGSMCAIQDAEPESGVSLGIFRPEVVEDFVIEDRDADVERERFAEALVAQGSLLADEEKAFQRKAIEQVPYTFKYRYRCADPNCTGHLQSLIDWEVVQLYRRVRSKPDWRERMRAKWLGEICGADKDTAFIVGNQHQHRNSFLVLGVWWPPKQPEQLALS
ncbi:hypothetical protein BH20ACT15_BH20ACT15_10780 [soil metagenome]